MACQPTTQPPPIYARRGLLRLFPLALLLSALVACSGSKPTSQAAPIEPQSAPQAASAQPAQAAAPPAEGAALACYTDTQAPAVAAEANAGNEAVAIFAGGCFWCMEHPFDELPGVISTTSGYTGGHTANPTYEQVSAGATGHAESVLVRYNPDKITYQKLLDVFWHNIDPVAVNRQFCDVGDQYRSAIFASNAQQRKLAETSKQAIEASGRFQQPIATQIVAASTFYPAEEYHQNYYEKNPVQYKFYRFNCGRDQRLREAWGKQG